MIKLNKSYNVEKKPLEYPLKNIYNKKAIRIKSRKLITLTSLTLSVLNYNK